MAFTLSKSISCLFLQALGCLLFELCALKPAFDAHNLISLFYKITRAEHSELPGHYSDDMKQLIKSILIKEPENRPRYVILIVKTFTPCVKSRSARPTPQLNLLKYNMYIPMLNVT